MTLWGAETIHAKLAGDENDRGTHKDGTIYRPNELYSGPLTPMAPDISFIPRDMRYKPLGAFDFSTNAFISPVYGRSGDHRMDGIIIMHGPGVKGGIEIEKASILDVTPTILALLGCPLPSNIDGRVLDEALDFSTSPHPVAQYPHLQEADSSPSTYTPEEEEIIRRRLADLGYL